MSLMRDGFWPPTPTVFEAFPVAPLFTRMPSMKNTGSFDSDTLLEPRMRTRAPPPVVPLEGSTVTPAARAFKRSAKFVIGAFSTSPAATCDTSLGISRAFCSWPVAVMTMAPSSCLALIVRMIGILTRCMVVVRLRECGMKRDTNQVRGMPPPFGAEYVAKQQPRRRVPEWRVAGASHMVLRSQCEPTSSGPQVSVRIVSYAPLWAVALTLLPGPVRRVQDLDASTARSLGRADAPVTVFEL